MPVLQRNIGTIGVVCPQQIGDDHKEIQQPPLFQCLTNGLAALAFTKRLVLDVRVRHALVGRGGIGILGNHAIVIWGIARRGE